MARIVGVDIPNDKKIKISLTYIHGIGNATALKVLENTKIDPEKRTSELTDNELSKLYEYIDKNLTVEGALKQKVFQHIKRLKDIRCYRGVRHKQGLPVRGQNTRKNARTRKGKNKPIAIINKVVKK